MSSVVTTSFISTNDRDRRITGRLNEIFAMAAGKRWSDIHFESLEDGSAEVRVRIRGKLKQLEIVHPDDAKLLINKLRYRANLDVSDTRHEQDGRFVQEFEGRRIDVRLNIVPTNFGYSAVVRLLDSANAGVPIEKLQMPEGVEAAFRWALSQREGLVLNGGPTGSGKTTTLYAGLNSKNTEDVKIITAEDPVEYILKRVQQIQVGSGTGRTFASALRAFMRQDPDIILVGEIRDTETGSIAMRAGMTGHLVMASIHANSSLETYFRLHDLEIPPHIIGASVRLFIAQRIVQTVCQTCREKAPVALPEVFAGSGIEAPDWEWVGKGCEDCDGTGYDNRMAIFEAIKMTRAFRAALGDEKAMEAAAKLQPQYQSLRTAGCNLIVSGETNSLEIDRALSEGMAE
ncbi:MULTISPECIES: GspE/PulE family protein [Acidithiobacillus]|uniref:Type IV pilus assembly protein TapB n=1 Tax=Acidithiobacillus thiooxidans ATCC 19377 TaxID=637390 RepID=A0A543Q6G2_ACITH|nr:MULTISPECIES: GspE/PulE family protein [Acidithiobacillus]MBU2740934.1 type II/IV secretion system protein [Acidithiobacillus albertensis]MDX5933865.1 GspE/PulE family protein [Acidithiobacillus thiooxidans]TQN51917.1 Type IV pilus assembly protein TapB [Acidithiobacillus thiooxidans ATCC 19377]